ncbi:UMP-CMP kinase-like [Planococcus citri]|uniref:UMP-CMP kinase-like n=1 Tax=Planococcus citri TaxID=170843 RepID=UPI0031F7F5BB
MLKFYTNFLFVTLYRNFVTMAAVKPKVIFVLGGPGAGKGTQCQKLVEEFKFKHISAGDLLREERNKTGSEFGELIETHIRNGTIVPVEITCKLIDNAIQASNTKVFLIDGFPRNKDNLDGWLREMSDKTDLQFVLFFDCPIDTCAQRCLQRGAAGSGRSDDNIESVRKRIVTFNEDTLPIVRYYEEKNLVKKIDSSKTAEEVHSDVRTLLSYLKT